MKGRSGHEPEIRFITSSYDELFRIPDGGTIQVTFPDRQFIERCEYIDDYHMRAGSTVYHICQYAEILERNGGRCEPEPAILLDQAAWQLGHKDYLLIHGNDEGWDYTLYDTNFHEIAGGHIVNPWCSMIEAREEILQKHGLASRVRIRVDYDAVKALASLEMERIEREDLMNNPQERNETVMTEGTEQGAILHDTPAEKDTLIRAMEAAGYTLDAIESTEDHLRFIGDGGQTMTMAGWHECEAWLNGVVFDDPDMSDRVEMILHPERFVTEAAATDTAMRSIEDLVEQNDNQFDGIINNLPKEQPAGTPDPGKLVRETADAAERRSVLEKLREEEQARAARPPRLFLPDRGERSFE